MASDYYSPTAIANEAIDAAALDFTLGDIGEGTRPAQVLLRKYSTCVDQLLRCASWNFARKQTPLVLLADATGQTANVGATVPGGQFIYEYAYPTDCLKLRYIPWCPLLAPGVPSGNIQPTVPTVPLMTGMGQAPAAGQRVVPARFLVTSDPNYIPANASNDTDGISPIGRTVILTNVQNAQAIYTFRANWPNLFDAQFRAALVAYLASEIAVPLATDKKFGVTMRDRNIQIAVEKIKSARVTDGIESWSNSDLQVDWMRARVTGGRGWWGGDAGLIGDWNCGYDSLGFANGSAY